MTTKKFLTVLETGNVEINKTGFLTGTSTPQKALKKEGIKLAFLLFF
jgi:hypothetical protein